MSGFHTFIIITISPSGQGIKCITFHVIALLIPAAVVEMEEVFGPPNHIQMIILNIIKMYHIYYSRRSINIVNKENGSVPPNTFATVIITGNDTVKHWLMIPGRTGIVLPSSQGVVTNTSAEQRLNFNMCCTTQCLVALIKGKADRSICDLINVCIILNNTSIYSS